MISIIFYALTKCPLRGVLQYFIIKQLLGKKYFLGGIKYCETHTPLHTCTLDSLFFQSLDDILQLDLLQLQVLVQFILFVEP